MSVIPKSPNSQPTTFLVFSLEKKEVNPDRNSIDSLQHSKLNVYLFSAGLLLPEKWDGTAECPIIDHKFTCWVLIIPLDTLQV